MTVPFAFANLSGNIALSKLDSNFNTPITIGNTSVQLGNTVTTLNNLTLANVTITSGTSNVTNVNVTSINVTNVTATLANVTTLNATSAFITTGNIATANVGNLTLLNALTVPNGGTGLVTLPVSNVLLGNGTSPIASVAPGNVGNVLTSTGSAWVSAAATGGGGSGNGTVTNVSVVTAKGFSGTVANSTSNAAITLSATFDGIAWSNATGVLSNVAIGTGLSFSNTTGVLTATGAVANAVTAVTATAPVFSSGGATPDISFLPPGTAGNVLTSTGSAWISNAAVGGGGTPGGNPGQIQYNNSGAFGGDANLTFSGSTTTAANLIVSNLTASLAVFSSSTKQLVSNPITGTGSVVMNSSPIVTSPSLITPALGSPTSGNMSATTNIPVANATGTLAVGNGGTGLQTIPAGNVVIGNGTSAVYGLAPGTAGNVLTSIGGAWVSNAAVTGSGSPGGNTTEFQYNNGGAFAGAANLTTDGANTTIRSANTFRFANLTSTRYVGFKANAIIAANVTWTLPVADGTSGQALTTDGAGNLSWGAPTPVAPTSVEYLVVAGGGGGGVFIGGGGGAGGLLTSTLAVAGSTSYTVTVGGGATGQPTASGQCGGLGSSSVFASITATGGGGGKGFNYSSSTDVNGGSGGGGRGGGAGGAGGTGISGQGFAGGNGNGGAGYGSPGGGGSGGLGVDSAIPNGSNGGSGTTYTSGTSITGLAASYAGGGGGAADYANPSSTGGTGQAGGGNGTYGATPTAATVNTGSGGGGAGINSAGVNGGNGASGVVIIAYSQDYPVATATTGSPTYSSVSRAGFHVYSFTGTGTITF
jgi:hypothetical protein